MSDKQNKTIWILNHHAIMPKQGGGTRHHNFGTELSKRGYKVVIIASSYLHGEFKYIHNDDFHVEEVNSNYCFVTLKTTPPYTSNGARRILNMYSYKHNVIKNRKKIEELFGKPDIVIGSSVHPLACIAALKLSKKYRAQCICEIRDFWPESLIVFAGMSPNHPAVKWFGKIEKKIYKDCDKLILTTMGGKDFLAKKGFDKVIDMNKVCDINNGVDLQAFDENEKNHAFMDVDLDDTRTFKVIYTGSIRQSDSLEVVVSAAGIIQNSGYSKIKFLIYGVGDDVKLLTNKCKEEKIENVAFKGFVSKEKIPYVLSKGDVNLMHSMDVELFRFGSSPNKLFEYFASGKPILDDRNSNYNMVKNFDAGIVLNVQSAQTIADAVIQMYEMPQSERDRLGENARKASESFDIKVLTDKLVAVFKE